MKKIDKLGFYEFTVTLTEGKFAYFKLPWPLTKEELEQVKKLVELMGEVGLRNHQTAVEEEIKKLKKQMKEFKKKL